ncbi:FkbM family methyltransferase [Bradyrhizobium diazoefficiens]|uniref:FkbM family methyltransferase n=1 Tax=Bradyrhizobium diazoefficiens TaxID=1355477 RepID=UPI00190D2F9D|nr:FkbM family methyltransferase [Bradyrhizobium diazoefficiens]QQO36487.1 FkbM family methyltransferase [Bradyrhizobium diazoefficiens]
MLKMLKKSAPLRHIYYRSKLGRASGQSDEGRIITELAADVPRTFVEIGFHPIEFNCVKLAQIPDWRGLLVDGSERQVADARRLFPDRVRIVQRFLTLDNLGFVKEAFPEIGVLSIDVDGNDYWFLKELLCTRPRVICVEYNSTFGLAPISVPYDPAFDRHKSHPRGWYHGASLTALAALCRANGYGLAAVSAGGTNAFFTPDGNLEPAYAWRPNTFRESFSGVAHDAQWASVSHLPFVTV